MIQNFFNDMKPIKYSEDSEMIRIGMKEYHFGYLSKTDVDMMKPISEYQDDITGIFKASDMVLKREEEGYYVIVLTD